MQLQSLGLATYRIKRDVAEQPENPGFTWQRCTG